MPSMDQGPVVPDGSERPDIFEHADHPQAARPLSQALPKIPDDLKLPPYSPPANPRSELQYLCMRNPTWEDIREFLIEVKKIGVGRATQAVEYGRATGWNPSGFFGYVSDMTPQDCAHEFVIRGIDCRRYE
ncbi:MAG: hypothetical protein KDD53_03560 [Bdellovibrionales bacterium]|nr:hypothetical protein [Bdellovibrionales bacterium]